MAKDSVKLKGCFRLHIKEGDKIVGDSGWVDNLVTNDGIEKFFCYSFSNSTGSLQVSHLAIGSGAAPASNATALPSEVLEASKRIAVTKAFSQRAASNGTATMWFTGTFASSDNFISTTYNISNIGLYNSVTNGTLMAGQIYASSALATNQNVEVTYKIQVN